jgi:hypothetical protein
MPRALFAWFVLLVIGCSNGGAHGHCYADYDSECFCPMEARTGAVEFEGTCNTSAFGGRTVCCRGTSYCRCEEVLCGISAVDGACLCGIGVTLTRTVSSCTGTAPTCCTQDTGYCYCEDGCELRFGNRVVASCDLSTDTARCQVDDVIHETSVTSCE